MVRHEIKQDYLTVAYGYDQIIGLFLDVSDQRVAWSSDNTEEVNNICNKIAMDGGGYFLQLHIGPVGFGHKVDKKTIINFMKKFDAKQEHLLELLNY